MNTERKQLIAERDQAFEHAARQYYIQCADRVISLAPLKPFRDALNTLKHYDQYPTVYNHGLLVGAYLTLKELPDEFGYSSVGQVFEGLKSILYHALFKRDERPSWAVQPFCEAKYLAALSVWKTMQHDMKWEPTAVLHAEDEHQHQIGEQLINEFYARYKDSNEEYLKSLKPAVLTEAVKCSG